ncbi:MAG: hypothetical protein JNK25_06135 [Phycisphaerae bacterium]|nr:hypothetical protein [Phycisphaerae bacterium]
MMNDPASIRTARIVRAADARVEPLYPPTRLLRSAEAEVSRLRAEAAVDRAAAATEASDLIAAARAEAGEIRDRAAREGANEAATRLGALVERAGMEWAAMRDQAEARISDLALRLARAVVDAEFAARPEVVRQFAVKALRHAGFSACVRIFLHPEDAALLAEHAPSIARDAAFDGDCGVWPDDSVPRGSVRIATDMGDYETGIEEQFAALRRAMLTSPVPGAPKGVE